MARFIPYTCLTAILLCIVFGAALCMAICAMVICMVWHITYLFCVGKVRPLYKKGDRSRPGNWRPICCAVTEAKLVSIVVFGRIPHRLYTAGVVPDNMWANVPGRSKQEASLLYDMYLDDEDPEALLASMDVKGAFPNTPHRLIEEVWRQLGLLYGDFVGEYLRTVRYTVATGKGCTEGVTPGSQVPQGGVEGPFP